MLQRLTVLSTDAAEEISKFAAYYHNEAAQEIAEVINEFIRDVSEHFRKFYTVLTVF